MTRTASTGWVSYLLVFFVTIPLDLFFLQELYSIPWGLRALTAAGVTLLCLVTWYLLRPTLNSLGKGSRGVLLGLLALGVFLAVGSNRPYLPTIEAVAWSADHQQGQPVTATETVLWERRLPWFALHPPFDGPQGPPHKLIGKFWLAPEEVTVWFAKPPEALFLENGAPTPSDGVTVEITVLDESGRTASVQKRHLTQEAFLVERWLTEKVAVAGGIQAIEVVVHPGPPGSTPYFDSTLVAFEVTDPLFWPAIGQLVLVALGFFNLGLVILLALRERIFPGRAGAWREAWKVGAWALLPAGFLLGLTYWNAVRTNAIYFWDFRNYWEKTERLHALLSTGAWWQALDAVVASIGWDYTLLPALLPALVSLPFGGPTRLVYQLIIVAIYAVPAFLAVTCLAKRLVSGPPGLRGEGDGGSWVLGAFAIIFGLPVFVSVPLYLMPDIGGVFLYVLAMFLTAAVSRSEWRPASPRGEGGGPHRLVCFSLALGLVLAGMFLFRRWYLFAVFGLVCAFALVSCCRGVKLAGLSGLLRNRLLPALVLTGFSSFTVLAWVLLDWTKNLGAHDYASLYSSYAEGLWGSLRVMCDHLGVVGLAVCLAALVLAWRHIEERRGLAILVISSLVAVALFFVVQTPRGHHLYLLMPLLGCSLAAALMVLRQQGRNKTAAGAIVLLVLAQAAATSPPQGTSSGGLLLPGFDHWLPKQQPHAAGLLRVAAWLTQDENRSENFCVIASGESVNQGIFAELWQIAPEIPRGTLASRLVPLGEVDSRDGPPAEAVRQCDIALVGVPLLTHLRPEEQYSVEILQQDLLSGTGIGAAFQREPTVFELDDQIRLHVYRRQRPISQPEYTDLVDRFHAHKQP